MGYICNICKREFSTINACKTHYCCKHHPSDEQKQMFFTSLHEKHFCPICGKQILYNLKGGRLFNVTCSAECARQSNIIKQKENYINNPEKRDIKRQQRLKYLSQQNHFINTAWGKRSNNKLSYLEEWFINNILEKFPEVFNKFDIINEYHIFGYSCDFAFLNLCLDVELDGKQHFCNGENRVQHDIKRDETFINNNWKIYRITYKEVLSDPNNTINDFINFIKNINILSSKKFDYDLYLTNKELNKIEQDKKLKEKEKEAHNYFEKIRTNIINVISSNINDIDFSKYGWVQKLKLKFDENNIQYDKNLSRYLHKYYPEFFELNKVFYRKGSIYK